MTHHDAVHQKNEDMLYGETEEAQSIYHYSESPDLSSTAIIALVNYHRISLVC